MTRYWRLDTAVCLITAILAAWATTRHPYSYYQAVRWLAFLTGGYMAWRLYQDGKPPLALLFGATAILFNPLAPFRMDRDTWATLDLACGGVFLFGAYLTAKLKPL
jgi:hypothetical protein